MTKLFMDDDTFERDLFRARAERLPHVALPSAESVIARAEARRRVRAIAFVPAVVARVSKTLARTAGPIAMMHAAAGIFVMVAWGAGVHVERARPDVASSDHAPNMSLDELPATTNGTRGTCEAAASFFGLTCESLPASMPLTMRERTSCEAPTQQTSTVLTSTGAAVCEDPAASICGDSVTCADDRP